jgi:hypothetical protein
MQFEFQSFHTAWTLSGSRLLSKTALQSHKYLVPPQCSVDLQRERVDDRRPKSNIRCEGLPEFFGV